MSAATTIRFDLQGMSCASCVGRVQAALSAVDGVTAPSVNLANHTAQITVSDPAAITAARDAVRAAGYPARAHTIKLQVDGMTCASCIAKVEGKLTTLAGVSAAQANLATGVVTIDALSSDPAQFTATLKALGYDATVLQSTDEPVDHSSDIRRRFMIAAVLTLPIFVMEMGGHVFPAFHHLIARTIGVPTSWMIQFVLATLVLAWPGRGFFRAGIPAMIRRAPDMNALVVLGAGAAWAYSTTVLFAPQLIPAADRAVYFEAAAVIVTLILLGRWLEARAKGKTGDAIRRLIKLRPDTALVLRDGVETPTPLAEVVAGDLILIKPGGRIAVDGVVVTGQSWIDESMITGEPIAVERGPDAPLIGGTINGNGALTMRATAVGGDTMLARIIGMVEDAQTARLPVQDLVNKIAGWFVPAVIVVAVLTVVGWLLFGPAPALSNALVAGVSVLIIACPCAMGLAVPVSIMVGTGRAAELGVLFRQGDALQSLGTIKIAAFDKTGTLTNGKPDLTDIWAVDGDTDRLLALTASVEALSEHPLAAPIVAAASALKIPTASGFSAINGAGLRADVDGAEILVGNVRLLSDAGVDVTPLQRQIDVLAADAKTPILVAFDGQALGVLGLSDAARSTSAAAIAALKSRGITPVMITGDTQATARAIADQLGITQIHAQTLPADKAALIKDLQSQGPVMFAGDGINDAPALAQADVGIAMGGGTDIAVESADVVLMRSDPMLLSGALTISAATMRNIHQNLGWAFGYNVLLIPVAALGLLSPALAAGAMALSSVLVVTNALRLKRVAR